MEIGLLLATIFTQVGSAMLNNGRSKKNAMKLAERQRELEEKIMKDGIDNWRKEYEELCKVQREIDNAIQNDRLELIRKNYLDRIQQTAYEVALQNWPLLTPPYVIEGHFINEIENNLVGDVIPLNCIVTTSTNPKFNVKIFPQLEERLAIFFDRNWNSEQLNYIRFYHNAWRDRTNARTVNVGSRIADIHAHLNEIPIIVVSPNVSQKGEITFSLYWWGLSNNPDDEHYCANTASKLDPKLDLKLDNLVNLDKDKLNAEIDKLVATLSAFISYFADLYYWNFYKISPKLPCLLKKKDDVLVLSSKDLESYQTSYTSLLKNESPKIVKKASNEPLNISSDSGRLFSSLYGFIDDSNYKSILDDYIENCFARGIKVSDFPVFMSILSVVDENSEVYGKVNGIIEEIKNIEDVFSMKRCERLTILDVLNGINSDELSSGLYDTICVVIEPKKFMVVTYCLNTKDNSVGKQIKLYCSRNLYVPIELADSLNNKIKLSIKISELQTYKNKISEIMKEEDLNKLFSDSSGNIGEKFSQVIDAFQNMVNKIKNEISSECNFLDGYNDIEIRKKLLTYEDLKLWIREYYKSKSQFNGFFATIQKASPLDSHKYKYTMHACFTINEKPQMDEDSPRIIFSFSELDSTLKDMFGDKKSLLIKL